MPPAANRSGIWTGLAAAGIGLLCLGGGWWLGQLQTSPEAADAARRTLAGQASDLQQRLNTGEASEAEQQRLLELLVALDRKAEATVLLERLADQRPQQWSLRLLLAELRRDQKDRSGAEREVRQLLNLRPDQIEGLQLMALLQLETGRGAQAQGQLEAALQRASKPQLKAEALPIGLLLANVLQKRGQPDQAESLLLKLAAGFPTDQRPLLARAMLQQERGDIKGAQESLALARARKPGPSDPRLDQVAAAWGLAPLRAPSRSRPAKPLQAATGNQNP
jgi:tetratricopeptide (TPR) repeat protein